MECDHMTSHITRRVGDRAKRIACHWSRKCRCLLPYAAICMIFAAALTLIAPCSASVRFCTGVRGRYIIGTASRRAGGVRGASRIVAGMGNASLCNGLGPVGGGLTEHHLGD